MDQFARIVVGYHGCTKEFARELLLGNLPISEWRPSANVWDWLGHGIYFWEHSPERALRWARNGTAKRGQNASIIGEVVQLGRCFDLLNEGGHGDSCGQLRRANRDICRARPTAAAKPRQASQAAQSRLPGDQSLPR